MKYVEVFVVGFSKNQVEEQEPNTVGSVHSHRDGQQVNIWSLIKQRVVFERSTAHQFYTWIWTPVGECWLILVPQWGL